MNKLDLKKLEEKLDLALAKETSESLTNWLEKRDINNNMTQQTSVEWLIDKVFDHTLHKDMGQIFTQARKMHKEETLRFVRTMPRETGVTQEGQSYVQYDAEEHYNQTYNKM